MFVSSIGIDLCFILLLSIGGINFLILPAGLSSLSVLFSFDIYIDGMILIG